MLTARPRHKGLFQIFTLFYRHTFTIGPANKFDFRALSDLQNEVPRFLLENFPVEVDTDALNTDALHLHHTDVLVAVDVERLQDRSDDP